MPKTHSELAWSTTTLFPTCSASGGNRMRNLTHWSMSGPGVEQIFGKHLPFFDRMDAGVNYRINRKNSAFNFSLDIQNVLNRHNVYKRNFSYVKGAVVQTDKKLIGFVPIAGLRFDF